MICSKFITFAVTKTTLEINLFKPTCCDLLKIHYLCGDKDNMYFQTLIKQLLWFAQNSLPLRWQRQHLTKVDHFCTVVICSKFITFAVTKTTPKEDKVFSRLLWFAQNSLPLRWQRQLVCKGWPPLYRCDLLKIHYLCGDKDNTTSFRTIESTVVICSKFITFAVTKTTASKVLLS